MIRVVAIITAPNTSEIRMHLPIPGSPIGGWATPTEAAGVGATGALLMALAYRRCNRDVLRDVCESTLSTTAMVFFILIGASIFSLVFRGYGGDELVQAWFENMPGGMWGALAIVMLVIFLLGFILDFIEITFVVVPIVGPVLMAMITLAPWVIHLLYAESFSPAADILRWQALGDIFKVASALDSMGS